MKIIPVFFFLAYIDIEGLQSEKIIYAIDFLSLKFMFFKKAKILSCSLIQCQTVKTRRKREKFYLKIYESFRKKI